MQHWCKEICVKYLEYDYVSSELGKIQQKVCQNQCDVLKSKNAVERINK